MVQPSPGPEYFWSARGDRGEHRTGQPDQVGRVQVDLQPAPARAAQHPVPVRGGGVDHGQRKRLATVVDSSAADWDRVLCSAGRRGLEIDLDPADLVRLTGAVLAPITAG